MALLPSELTTKEFPVEGGEALLPVVQNTSVDVWLTTTHEMPSIVTVTVVPKLVPVMWMTSLPMLGPNDGLTAVTTDVELWE